MRAVGTRRQELGRWVLAAGLGLALHAGIVVALVTGDDPDVDGGEAGAFVIELAAIPVARADVPESVAPGPDQVETASVPATEPAPEEPETEATEAQPAPEALPEVPPLPMDQAEAVLPPRVPPEPPAVAQAAQTPQAPAPTTSATQAVADQVGERALAPRIAPPSRTVSHSLPTWQAKLATALERSKRYPSKSQARREQGTVQVLFVIDRSGHLVSSRIARSSGHELLDNEALALLERAQPLPPPPAELRGLHISLAVPVHFTLR